MDIDVIEILKWVGVAFAAGFIGYFGRYLGMLIIDGLRKRKSQQTPAAEPLGETTPVQDSRLEESRLKVEKKRAKAEAKRAKKAVAKINFILDVLILEETS